MRSIKQVLNTKLRRPDLPGDFVPRPHLVEYVNRDLERPLTLVSAGAGFGKSTFVSSWFRELPYRNCWLSLDENDNDLRTFLLYFLAAMDKALPGFGSKTRTLLTFPQLPGEEVLRSSLINDLSALTERVVLALDDFYVIHDPQIIRVISGLLRFPPKNFHLVIITRSDPSLPLSRLRARNKMKDIRSSHLRMTKKEICIFLKNHLKTDQLEEVVDLLNAKLEGWITGLRIAVLYLSMQNSREENIVEILTGTLVSETYFLDEVLEYLDENTSVFLLKTSVLQKFNPELADFVMDDPSGDPSGSQEVLQELLRKNLFIIPLDREKRWFRYHHLFQALLQKELNKRFPEERVIRLHKRAAEWYESAGLIDEALFHASQTGDLDTMAALIERNMHTPIDEDKWYLLERWLRQIPETMIRQSPDLLIAKMWVFHHKNIIWSIPGLLTQFEKIRASRPPDRNTVLQAQFFQGVILFWGNEIKESLQLFGRVRKEIPEKNVGTLSLVRIYYATASQLNGSGQQAYEEMQSILYGKEQSSTSQVLLLGALQYIALLAGDLFKLERLSREMLNIGITFKDLFAQSWSNYFLGYVACHQNKLSEAEVFFREALNNKYQLNMKAPVDTFAGLLLTLKLQKKQELYDRVYDELLAYVREWNNPVYTTMAYSLRARLALMDGDLRSAVRLIRMADMFFDSGTVLFEIEIPRLTWCQVLLTQDSSRRTTEALEKLQEHLALAQSIRNVPFLIRTLILLAVAYYKKGDPSQAGKALLQALREARQGTWIRPFLEGGPIIGELLSSFRHHKETGEFASLILEELSAVVTDGDAHAPPKKGLPENYQIDPLTNRELDILHLLAQRMSNKEIANMLFISESTVKRHTINIYQKLNVHKRREAVETAKVMGIL